MRLQKMEECHLNLQAMDEAPEFKLNIEKKRIEALKSYSILNTPQEQCFDRFTSLTAQLMNLPMCLIYFVDADWFWIKSRYGIAGITQIKREDSFLNFKFKDNFFSMEDALKNTKAMESPLFKEPWNMRFFCAVPIQTKEGHILGALSVLNNQPTQITDKQKAILGHLAKIIMDFLEFRKLSTEHTLLHQNPFQKKLHDFKNLLTIISLSAELMLEEPLTENANELCYQIINASKSIINFSEASTI